MRPAIILLIVLFINPCLVNAQFVNGVGAFGKIGVSAQNWQYTNPASVPDLIAENLAVFGGGFYLEMLRSKHFKLRPQLTYLQRGYSMKFDQLNQLGQWVGEVVSEPRIHYVTFDILGKLTLDWKKVNPYVVGGFRFDLKVAETTDAYTANAFKNFNTVEAGFVGAFGVEFWRVLFLEFEFNPTFGSSFSSVDLNISNTLYTFNLGLRLAKKEINKK